MKEDTYMKSKEELGQEIRKLKSKLEREVAKNDKLTEQIKGYEELITINNGIVAAVLRGVGATEDRPVLLARDAVTRAMNEVDVLSKYDAETQTFHMAVAEKGGQDDESCNSAEA